MSELIDKTWEEYFFMDKTDEIWMMSKIVERREHEGMSGEFCIEKSYKVL